MSSHARMLGRLTPSTVVKPRHSEQAETEPELQGYDIPQLTPSVVPAPAPEHDMKNALMNALNGPSKKLTPMDKR